MVGLGVRNGQQRNYAKAVTLTLVDIENWELVKPHGWAAVLMKKQNCS